MNPEERAITIKGTTATLHAWGDDNNEITLDYTMHVNEISKAIKELEEESLPKIIGIEGDPGSGKSNLAKVLHSSGNNTVLIDVTRLHSENSPYPDLTLAMSNLNKTYIIDEAGITNKNKLWKAITRLTSMGNAINGNVVILIYQRYIDVIGDDNLKNKNHNGFESHYIKKRFKLSRAGLTKISEENS